MFTNPQGRTAVGVRSRRLAAFPVSLVAAFAAEIAPARAQGTVLLTDAQQQLVAEVGAKGLVRLTVGGDTFRFVPLHPLLVRVTYLSGGRMTWSEHTGEQLGGVQTTVQSLSGTAARVTWAQCTVPGVAGSFDVVYDYSSVPLPHGPGVGIRGHLQRSSLATGIAAIGYRQYLTVDVAPQTVISGFTGAAQVAFADLAGGSFDLSNAYMATGGELRFGAAAERFLTTRTGESMLVAATLHANRKTGLLLTRDGRNDPDNVARELGLLGANDVQQDPRPEFGAGVLSYLPNDDRPGNGGAALAIGSGLVLGTFAQENASEPYWDVVRAYRARWVEPMLAGLVKPAERPPWLAASTHVVLNVADAGVVRHEAVAAFMDEYLQYHDQIRDVAVLLWGATEGERFTAQPGLSQLASKLNALELRRGSAVRTALYYLPTWYDAGVSGGTRLDEVCRDPFGNPLRFPNVLGGWTYGVNVGSPANDAFFAGWLATTPPAYGIDGVYFDDAFRHRTFDTWHYERTAPVQGRTEQHVAEYIGQMRDTNASFAARHASAYLVTELALLGRSVPGNLIQGVGGLEPIGPFFASAAQSMLFQPFANDVAGHHWLSGYAGTIAQSWIYLRNLDDLTYFGTPVVRGLVPVHAPLALNGSYYDFFQLCRDHIIDCNDPRFRAVGVQSAYENAGAAFFRRHNAILTGWRRQPVPGTHDIAKHQVAFNDRQGKLAYTVEVDEVPFGCFSDGARVAIALTNPLFAERTVSFRLQRDRYDTPLVGNYRVSVQLLSEAQPRQLLERASGDLQFSVTLPSREYAMLIVEPVPCTFTSTANAAGCGGGTLTGSATAGAGGEWIQLAIAGAPRDAAGVLLYGARTFNAPLPGARCLLLVDTSGAIALPYYTDASGKAGFKFQIKALGIAHLQAITLQTSTKGDALLGTNALQLECR